MEVDVINNVSDEEYVVQRAKSAIQTDPSSAKAWMITAKTLYPNNFAVQFEAYKIEKAAKHVKEAAKCFTDLLGKFQQETEFWKEIEDVTAALRSEVDPQDTEKLFLVEMFEHISAEVQHQLLLFTADRCEDTMEHCKLLLLLLQKFPSGISTHGPRLVDTLLSAEKHSHFSNQPVNPYRKLLVCELLPLLRYENKSVELSSKLLYKLLHKSIEFYLAYMDLPSYSIQDGDTPVDQAWNKLYGVLELTGRYLCWDLHLISFNNNWTKESYWQKIVSHKTVTVDENTNTKQLLYCLTIFFLHCLREYLTSLTPEACPGQVPTTLLLVEAFTDSKLPNPVQEPKSKRRKSDSELNTPFITVDKSENRHIISNFNMAAKCWDFLHSYEALQREFYKLNSYLKLDSWLSGFSIDYLIYKGRYDEALEKLKLITEPHLLVSKNIRLACIWYLKSNITVCFEHILMVVQSLPNTNIGALSPQLTVGGTARHLHLLPLTQIAVLQYCVKLLIKCIKTSLIERSTNYNELAIGNILVLLQLDWPQEEEMLPHLLEKIRQRGSFSYFLFQNYIINVDILEELTYLWSDQGGQITLDIIPHLGQRRIGTRGADKGVKGEIKQVIKRQVARTNEPLDQLIIRFITQEQGHILQSLM